MTSAPDHPRRKMMAAALAERPEAVVEISIWFWNRLAPELIAIVGTGGFRPLYARSVKLAGKRFPWLSSGLATPDYAGEFSELRSRLGGQSLAEAALASEDLFNVFFDLLASLIGESLTNQILNSAWNLQAPEMPKRSSHNG